MGKIIVIGNINHDRIWRLDGALVSGARLALSGREVRLGGGGYYTGSQLSRLGHEVLVLSNIADDQPGRHALAELSSLLGLDTSLIRLVPGETVLTEVLIDRDGERTIISPAGKLRLPFAAPEGIVEADAAYINGVSIEPGLLSLLERMPFVVSQFPLRAGSRPADVMIGSRADMAATEIGHIWNLARQIAGLRLRTLVLTDGPRDVVVFDGHREIRVQPMRRIHSPDTTGAGDFFAASYLDAALRGLDPEAAAQAACEMTQQRLLERDNAARCEAP